ncbi:Uncharacterised protein [Legionella pneumophila]|nr:Uncharacterised protein [Legionella pneumophila]
MHLLYPMKWPVVFPVVIPSLLIHQHQDLKPNPLEPSVRPYPFGYHSLANLLKILYPYTPWL